jgi:Family of unknown function (DUF6338)
MPDTFQALGVTILAFLPGALYIWSFEREVGRWGISLADRIFRFLGVSAIFLAVYSYPAFLVWTHYLHRRVAGLHPHFENLIATGASVAWWVFLIPIGYVAVPIVAGTLAAVTVRAHASWVRRIGRVVVGRDPAPRAWDDLFFERPEGAVRIRLKGDDRERWIGGLFAADSYAAGYPEQPQDLLIERAYLMEEDGSFAPGPGRRLQGVGLGYTGPLGRDKVP